MIIDAIRGLNRELAVEPTTGKKYVPSLRIVFPASPNYRYLSRDAFDDTAVSFIDFNNQAQAISKLRSAEILTDGFNEVGTTQSCSRQLILSINNAKPDMGIDRPQLVATKTLKDGRVAYIIKDSGCPYPADNLLDHLKQVESF
jgi:hypothetical protein